MIILCGSCCKPRPVSDETKDVLFKNYNRWGDRVDSPKNSIRTMGATFGIDNEGHDVGSGSGHVVTPRKGAQIRTSSTYSFWSLDSLRVPWHFHATVRQQLHGHRSLASGLAQIPPIHLPPDPKSLAVHRATFPLLPWLGQPHTS